MPAPSNNSVKQFEQIQPLIYKLFEAIKDLNEIYEQNNNDGLYGYIYVSIQRYQSLHGVIHT